MSTISIKAVAFAILLVQSIGYYKVFEKELRYVKTINSIAR